MTDPAAAVERARPLAPDVAVFLRERIKDRGPTSPARIARFEGRTDIRIPMPYGLAWIEGSAPSPTGSS